MSFLITVPQACIIAIVIGAIVYIYLMIRASVKQLRPQQKEISTPVSPSPPPSISTPTTPQSDLPTNSNSEQKRSIKDGVKRLLHRESRPIDERLKHIEGTQKRQSQRFDALDTRIRELKYAIEMKPDESINSQVSSNKKSRGRKKDVSHT